MAQYAVGPQVTQVWTGRGPVLLANQDLVNPVTVADLPNVAIGAQNADVIPPLGSIAYTGDTPLYAIAAAGTAALLVVAGGSSWAPSPAQVALQIQALGLAKDTTVQAVSTTLGSPAQDASVQAVKTTLGNPAQDASVQAVKTTLGGPAQDASVQALPATLQPVMHSTSATKITPGSSPFTVHTFGANSRIWVIHLSYAAATNNAYTAGTLTQLVASLETGGGLVLTVVELVVSNANQAINGDSDLVFSSGLPISSGDTLILNVNGGAALTNGTQRASCAALYSTP